MTLFKRQSPVELDQPGEDYTQKGFNRRAFVQHTMAIGLTGSAASTLFSACDAGGNKTPTVPTASSVTILTSWTPTELKAFQSVLAPFKQQQNITVNLETVPDPNATLATRLKSKALPDIVVLSDPDNIQQLARQKHLIRLDTFLNMDKFHHDYAQTWLDLGSYHSALYAIFLKAANKGIIWYNPAQFHGAGYQVPQSWPDIINFSNSLALNGKYAWSLGVADGANSGWPALDWIAEAYLNESGSSMYDKWLQHKIPWTDDSVKSAFRHYASLVRGSHYINGAPQSILSTSVQQASLAPFTSPPTAYLYYLGDAAATYITEQFPHLKPGVDYDFFPFPTFTDQYKGSVIGSVDSMVALKDNTAVRALLQYLATAEAQAIWVKHGGFISLNKSVPLSDYPNVVSKKSAQMLNAAPTFRFAAGDILPPLVRQAFLTAIATFIGDPDQLDNVLGAIELAAQKAYIP